jgi:hypothetical protein
MLLLREKFQNRRKTCQNRRDLPKPQEDSTGSGPPPEMLGGRVFGVHSTTSTPLIRALAAWFADYFNRAADLQALLQTSCIQPAAAIMILGENWTGYR